MRISDWSSDVCSSDLEVEITDAAVGLAIVAIPVIGSLLIGVMARFGSEKIRGHGIPEAIETILFGESRLSLKVAILKPISAAISIGSGGPFGAAGPVDRQRSRLNSSHSCPSPLPSSDL